MYFFQPLKLMLIFYNVMAVQDERQKKKSSQISLTLQQATK